MYLGVRLERSLWWESNADPRLRSTLIKVCSLSNVNATTTYGQSVSIILGFSIISFYAVDVVSSHEVIN